MHAYIHEGSHDVVALNAAPQVMTSFAHRMEPMYVIQGSTLEIALAQFWSSAGDTQGITLKVDFHGIVASPQSVIVDGAGGPRRVDVRATLKARSTPPMPAAA